MFPLFSPGYFYAAHDGRHSVFYLVQFDASIRDGALWPRWAMHHTQGYGYPTFLIQAPLGFYFAELFILLGAGYTLAAKISWVSGTLIGGWGMYSLVFHWLRLDFLKKNIECESYTPSSPPNDLSQRLTALAAAVIYTYAPYHLLGIYVRAALNDTLLFAWFPWIFLLFDRLLYYGGKKGWAARVALSAFALGGILLTHTFALISFTPLLISYVTYQLGFLAWQAADWRAICHRALLAAGAGIGALLLYAAFLLPLLMEGSPYLKEQVYLSNTYDFRRHFVYWGQFFSPFWGFGFSDDPHGARDGMGFQVGALLLLLALVSLHQHGHRTTSDDRRSSSARGTGAPRQKPVSTSISLYLLVVSIIILVFMTPLAKPLWESIPLLPVIQFPWRLLSLVTFTLSGLAGLTLWNFAAASPFSRKVSGGSDGGESEATAGLILVTLLAVHGVYSYVGARLEPVEPWREDGRAVVFFEREHPDMMGYTTWVQEEFTTSPMTANYLAENYREDYTAKGSLDRLLFVEGDGQILSRYSRGSTFGGVVLADVPSTVRVLVYHFPGWKVTLDGKPVTYSISVPEGLIDVQVPAGEHHLKVEMEVTQPRQIGMLLSGGTFLLLLVLLLGSRYLPALTENLWNE